MIFSVSLTSSSFTNHLRRPLVIAQADKSAMPQVSGVRPFDERHLADELRFEPPALLHFLHGYQVDRFALLPLRE